MKWTELLKFSNQLLSMITTTHHPSGMLYSYVVLPNLSHLIFFKFKLTIRYQIMLTAVHFWNVRWQRNGLRG